jgi:hypothetical protein
MFNVKMNQNVYPSSEWSLRIILFVFVMYYVTIDSDYMRHFPNDYTVQNNEPIRIRKEAIVAPGDDLSELRTRKLKSR